MIKFTPMQSLFIGILLVVGLGFAGNLILTEIDRRNCNPTKRDCSKYGVDSRDWGVRDR